MIQTVSVLAQLQALLTALLTNPLGIQKVVANAQRPKHSAMPKTLGRPSTLHNANACQEEENAPLHLVIVEQIKP